MPSENQVRVRRLETGLSQTDLARRAGVSRQLVAAVEAGRHTPGVDAALRLAGALAATVEELFEPPMPRALPALGSELREGARVRVGRVGDRLVAAELTDHGVSGSGWAAADGVWSHGCLSLFAGAGTEALVVAGCEPGLGLAEKLLGGSGARTLMTLPAPTDVALDSLRHGRVHGAAVHGPKGGLPRAPAGVRRIHFARWLVGLGIPRSRPGSLESILGAGKRVVMREPAAAAQQAFERALSAAGLTMPASAAVASGHLDSARMAATLGCPGVMSEPAAGTFGLGFLPFEEHQVEVWIDRAWLDHAGARALQELLASRGFAERLSGFGGYELSGCGTPVRG